MSAVTSGYEHEEKIPASSSPQLSSHNGKHEKVGLETAPPYEGEEDRRGSIVVTTAEDLVTQVIGLEDDPSLSPWTFRAMFLGEFGSRAQSRIKNQEFSTHSLAQVLACPLLGLFSKKSSTSSLRPSMCRSCFSQSLDTFLVKPWLSPSLEKEELVASSIPVLSI